MLRPFCRMLLGEGRATVSILYDVYSSVNFDSMPKFYILMSIEKWTKEYPLIAWIIGKAYMLRRVP